ncbi:MAG: sigma-70 family RNA polymerase sigma factor [Prevotella sp.]
MTIRRIEFLREFESLYRENYSRMYFFSLTLVGEEESARDIVSDIFSKVWDDYDLLDHRNMRSYLMTSVRNRSVDHLRRQQRTGRQTDISHLMAETDTLQWDEDREIMLQQLERDLLALPELTQSVLRLCYYKRMTYSQTAETLGITPRMVKRHITNALTRLREKYGVHKKS